MAFMSSASCRLVRVTGNYPEAHGECSGRAHPQMMYWLMETCYSANLQRVFEWIQTAASPSSAILQKRMWFRDGITSNLIAQTLG